MQDWQDQDGLGSDDPNANSLFGRWRVRLAQALLREPSVVLIDRDADEWHGLDDRTLSSRETMN